jgi:hypothetical protein
MSLTVVPTASQSPLCFVIGPIGKDGTDLRKHADLLLHAVIKHVLESAEFGYRVKRADEDADPGMIGDRVVADILRAELVVADLTDLNPNALYELGIRHATEKPTVHVARAGTMLPFDNISHRTIFIDLSDWHSIETGRSRLCESARAIKDPDYRVSNPITQANASFKMRESADPRESIVAELQERLASIDARLSGVSIFDVRSYRSHSPSIFDEERLYIYLETKHLFGDRGKIIKMLYTDFSSIGNFLDHVFYELNSFDKNIKAFSYNDQWFIEDHNGKRLFTTRSDGNQDMRSLDEAGIYPDAILRVKPARPDWAQG